MKNALFLTCLVVLSSPVFSQPGETAIRKHIRFLASDSMMGRGTGTNGEKMAAAYIATQFKSIGLTPKGDSLWFQSFPFKGGVHETGAGGIARNIIGFIDNHATETVIIGAHYDHLGTGIQDGSLDPNPKNKIHNGADDNASGTAGVIELARYFQQNKIMEHYNFLFICFSGEELGLFGSKYFTEHPTIDLSHADYMINMDMVGRLDPVTHVVSVGGSGTSALWEPLLKGLSDPQLVLKTDSSGIGPSDHSSFYLKNIPVLHFWTGSHSDYHKPSDDAEKINYKGEVEVLGLIIRVINKLDQEPKLAFLATKNKSSGGRSSFKVTMGIMPSYTSDVTGLQVDGVSDGKPAQKAGILQGDIIVQIGTIGITDINTYMGALNKFEKGQVVPVKVKRGEKIIELTVTF